MATLGSRSPTSRVIVWEATIYRRKTIFYDDNVFASAFHLAMWRKTTVDGRNPAPVDMENLPFFHRVSLNRVSLRTGWFSRRISACHPQ